MSHFLVNNRSSLATSSPKIPNNIITYSPTYTLVPTYECFNRCSYCNFRIDLGKSSWLTLEKAHQKLLSLPELGVQEILILSGEVHPDSPQRLAWFQRIYDLGELALSMGFLPHTNVGPITQLEMLRLKEINASLGLMLEQVTPELLKTVHSHSPSKIPELRLQQLVFAGELQIPFTTGLLLGIGETEKDWSETLETISQVHEQYHHLQEVILQPYYQGRQETAKFPPFPLTKMPEVTRLARQILPAEITIQIPPNLVHQPEILHACIEGGARDLGGISLYDEVNPDAPYPPIQVLENLLAQWGWNLTPRFPVYPQFYQWLPERLQTEIYLKGEQFNQKFKVN